PYSTDSLFRLRNLHRCIQKDRFDDDTSSHIDLLFAIPEAAYRWYKKHTFGELIEQWVEAAAYNVTKDVCPFDIVINQTPPTLLTLLEERIGKLKRSLEARKRFPRWLNH